MSLTDAQLAAAFFALPFLTLTVIWLTAAAAFTVFCDEPFDQE
jgi:hypothetical protein